MNESELQSDIRLTVINDSTHEVLTVSQVAPLALPDSFRAETTLNISDENWWVVEAEPTTRQEVIESGALELRLRRIESVASQGVRFSLPTICDALPPTEGPLLEGTELLLHEDDWRQVEWIAAVLEPEVQGELDAIRPLLAGGGHDDGSESGRGFPDLYPRRGLRQPLAGSQLRLEDLGSAFPSARRSRVAFDTSSQTIEGSFALFLSSSRVLYGLVGSADRVEVLALAVPPWASQEELPHSISETLRHLTAAQDLLLVDWCGARSARPGDEVFGAILQK